MRILPILLTLAGLTSTAAADKRLQCDMRGSFIEARENFMFVATYIAKDGPDTFQGVYVNTGAGARAEVDGAATNGRWVIRLTYTDAKHKGLLKELVGTGKRDPKKNELIVTGDFTSKQNGAAVGKGRFQLNGKCR